MKSLLSTALSFGLAAGAAINGPRQAEPDAYPASCITVSFSLPAFVTNNKNLTNIPQAAFMNLTVLKDYFNSAAPFTASGTETIRGTYCPPAVTNSNNTKLEVFFGSILTNRADWQAQGGVGTPYAAYKPEKYSWTQYANNLGYPTLALDRLGTGSSSHPDPVNVVQTPYEGALYNELAKQIRFTNTQFPKPTTLIYVGNSYGSQVGVYMAGTYPLAFDTFILTGYSKNFDQDFYGVLKIKAIMANTLPRFATLPPNYLTASNETALIGSFFGSKAQVSYEDTVADLFYQREDVVSVGQFVDVYAYPYSGAGFRGRVFVLTGEQDQAVCGPGSPDIGPANCGTLLQQSGSVFPNANYNYVSVNATGHAIQLCNSAQIVFRTAHQFLNGRSFQGGPPITN